MTDQAAIFDLIVKEREHQERNFPTDSCSNPDMADEAKLAVLTEEVGEVAREINEDRLAERPIRSAYEMRMKAELVQVAAVAVAWLESF